jgi:hypothetical protein
VARDFHCSPQAVADGWPAAQCWAYKAWLTENDAWMLSERASDGYLAQEIERLK